MTADSLDASSLGAWFPAITRSRITIAPSFDAAFPASTSVGQERTYGTRVANLQRIVDTALRVPYFQPRALMNLAQWLSSLPLELPEPFLAVADDGSISSEWDIRGNSLHVTFFDSSDEVYFVSPGGEEWEGTLDAVDKLSEAMRAIVRASRE